MTDLLKRQYLNSEVAIKDIGSQFLYFFPTTRLIKKITIGNQLASATYNLQWMPSKLNLDF